MINLESATEIQKLCFAKHNFRNLHIAQENLHSETKLYRFPLEERWLPEETDAVHQPCRRARGGLINANYSSV